jgi:hypothetical protein
MSWLSSIFKKPDAQESRLTNQLEEMSRADYEDYKTRLAPYENELMESIDNPAAKEAAAAEAGARSDRSFDVAAGSLARQMGRRGVTATPEQRAAIGRRTGLARAVANVDAQNTSRFNTEAANIEDAGFLVERGRGTAGAAATGLARAAQSEVTRNSNNAAAQSEDQAGKMKTVAAVAAMFMSSREYKEDIAPVSSTELIDLLQQIDVVQFKYRPEVGVPGHYVGAIAEDVPALFATEDRKALNSYNLIGALVSAVQTLSARVNQLEAVKE